MILYRGPNPSPSPQSVELEADDGQFAPNAHTWSPTKTMFTPAAKHRLQHLQGFQQANGPWIEESSPPVNN
jgi:hypothetical protein